ncbi:unnamed protein product [Symbiodinium sp. CCMP2456]|nr:unnamed protein product [Symbiodinium sp. CCMP2456]
MVRYKIRRSSPEASWRDRSERGHGKHFGQRTAASGRETRQKGADHDSRTPQRSWQSSRDRSRSVRSEGCGRVVLRAREASRSRSDRRALSPSVPRQPPRRRRQGVPRSNSEVGRRDRSRLRGQSAEPVRTPKARKRALPRAAEKTRAPLPDRPDRKLDRLDREPEPSRERSERASDSRESRDRERSARDRQQKEYMQMAAQQAAYMQFMHNPGYMAMMQQMGMMPPHMMPMGMRWGPSMGPGVSNSRSGKRSSSSESYSSKSRREGAQPSASANLASELEEFLQAASDLEVEVANRLRDMPPHLQQEVMRRGPLDVRSPTSSLLSRMKQALEADRSGCLRGRHNGGMRPVKQSAKTAIEALINDFHLQPECAWMLRSLPPDKQKLAARIDPSGQEDASGYVAEELKKIV